jgi:hypothetical protein
MFPPGSSGGQKLAHRALDPWDESLRCIPRLVGSGVRVRSRGLPLLTNDGEIYKVGRESSEGGFAASIRGFLKSCNRLFCVSDAGWNSLEEVPERLREILAIIYETHGIPQPAYSGQDPNREILAYILDPTTLPDRPQPERDRFIKALGSDFGAVLDSFGIANGDAAETDRHRRTVAYSLSSAAQRPSCTTLPTC